MNLYYGGCGNYMVFVVAESVESANIKIGVKINAPFLPVDCEKVDDIDGFQIVPVIPGASVAIPFVPADARDENELRHCKKCDFTCENQGDLLKHYRENHPKGA